MIINKYTWWRRAIIALYSAFPPARHLKNISPRLKHKRYLRRKNNRTQEIDVSLRETGKFPLFKRVELETFNRCNGTCSFCPVNKHVDTRKPVQMEEALFKSIIKQLRDLEFRGSLCLYSNNEPLLDNRIFEFLEIARTALPNATLDLSTNGILLDSNSYLDLMKTLDGLTIDNYCIDFKFRPNIQKIIDISSNNEDLDKRTRITMRYSDEIMTNRGGQAPNKKGDMRKTLPFGCISPTQQFIIRPDGKLSLCCNDALGKVTMGDLNEDSIGNIWFGDRYTEIKSKVMKSREIFDICRACDTMNS